MNFRLGSDSRKTAPRLSSQLLLDGTTEQPAFHAANPPFLRRCLSASAALLFSCLLLPAAQAEDMHAACPAEGAPSLSLSAPSLSSTSARTDVPHENRATACAPPAASPAADASSSADAQQLIVIGFMGGRVKGGNLIHKEAQLAKALQERYPRRVYARVFANHHAKDALDAVLHLLDRNRDGHLTTAEKSSARIVIYGHSWGASETVAFARQLSALDIPVLLTVQVDSVQKQNENDGDIPPNVREAVNFYQTEGLLHGRSLIAAMDPTKTTILGNFESSYKNNPVPCTEFPWIARTFMRPHIEIENDPTVWEKIDALIQAKVS